nr:hypothetical protein [uncultured Oscillibacter sp.]
MIWVMMVTGLIARAAGGEGLVACVLRLAVFLVMMVSAWRFARGPYLTLLNSVSRGWWLFSAMTAVFYNALTIVGGIPTNLRMRPDAMRIVRHDMRHQLQTVASLAQNGDTAALLDYVGKSQKKLDSTTPERYCSHPVLDAVLANVAA